jgi:hypothetical protein
MPDQDFPRTVMRASGNDSYFAGIAGLSWGEFVITPDGRRARHPIVISRRSAIPPFSRATSDERFHAFQYELYPGALDDPENDWGNPSFAHQGLDEGVEFNPVGMGGEVTANARHMLTFSEDSGL